MRTISGRSIFNIGAAGKERPTGSQRSLVPNVPVNLGLRSEPSWPWQVERTMRPDPPHPQHRKLEEICWILRLRNRSDTFPSLSRDHTSGLSFATRLRAKIVSLDAARSQESQALLVTVLLTSNVTLSCSSLCLYPTPLTRTRRNTDNSPCFANSFGVF